MIPPPRVPDVEAQRTAMKKLDFLLGKWSGEARVLRGPGELVDLIQTEEAQYKLDGLILVIEGIGKTRAEGKLALQALGIVSYDDEAQTYPFSGATIASEATGFTANLVDLLSPFQQVPQFPCWVCRTPSVLP